MAEMGPLTAFHRRASPFATASSVILSHALPTASRSVRLNRGHAINHSFACVLRVVAAGSVDLSGSSGWRSESTRVVVKQ